MPGAVAKCWLMAHVICHGISYLWPFKDYDGIGTLLINALPCLMIRLAGGQARGDGDNAC